MTASPEDDAVIEEMVFGCLEAEDPDTELASLTLRHPAHAERVRRIYDFLVAQRLIGDEGVHRRWRDTAGPPRRALRARRTR